jgi:hypothetical protein
MAWANSAVSDIIATTIESRTMKVQDNLTNNNALIRRLKERGRIKSVSGGSIIDQEIIYNDPSTNYAASYSGYDTINIAPDSPISAAQFNIKHYADAVSISGPELLANSGKEQMIDLLSTRIDIAQARLLNKIDLDLHGDGTGNSAKNLDGLYALLTNSPATGTYGGISRATWGFWRPQYQGGTTLTASTIQASMNTMALNLVRGTDYADLIYAGANAFQLYLNSLQAIQRITSEDKSNAGIGFASLKYFGAGQAADVIYGGGIGGNQPTNVMAFINSNFLYWRPHKDRNFVPIGGDRQSVNQDAVVKLIGVSGNLTCSGAQFHGWLNVI